MKKSIPLILITFLLLTATCKKDELAKVTKLEIGSESNVTETTATIGAKFIDVSPNVSAFGHCWATNSNPLVTDNKKAKSGAAQKGNYTTDITDLSSSTTYYVRAYAMEGNRAVYSSGEVSFTTLAAKYINITAPVATDNWPKGSTQNIEWDDNIDENVLIELYKGGTLFEEIESSTESDGSYNWPLDNALSSGTDYSIKISSVDDTSISDQTGQFEISETPNISITVPTTGTDWQKGSSQTITWTDNLDENVKIELFKAGVYDSDIAASTASDGSEGWIVPTSLEADNNYTIKISSLDDESISDESAYFTISKILGITITSPTNSSSWQMGNTENITWNDNISENVTIELYKAGSKDRDINSSTESDGSFEWNIPTDLVAGTDYRIKITSINDAGITDESEAFEITAVSNITITAPTSGSNWQIENSYDITWTDNISGNVIIELYKGGVKQTDLFTNTASDGTENWTITSGFVTGSNYTIKITSVNDATITDESGQFEISAAFYITINSPTNESHWAGGKDYSITWADNIDENVTLQLLQGSSVVLDIASSPGVLSNGSYSWSIPTNVNSATNYRMKISSVTNPQLYGNSDYFEIVKALQDNDGNMYEIIRIGEQWWMAENLKTRKFNDESFIAHISNEVDWANRTTSAYCWYDNDQNSYKNTYGALYNWFAVNTGKLCPVGWHVPTIDEWRTLENFLVENGYNFDGTTSGNKIAKAMASASNWIYSPDIGVPGNTDYPEYRNKSGFNGQPGGKRDEQGTYSTLGNYGRWWSSTEYLTTTEARYMYIFNMMYYTNSGGANLKNVGLSVRCVKD